MLRLGHPPIDFIWGGNACLAAQGVCWGRGSAELGNFLGRARSMLALKRAWAWRIGSADLRRGNGGFPPFPRPLLVVVARPVVARTRYVLAIMGENGRRRLIANLTTLTRNALGQLAGPRSAATAGGVSPLSARALAPHAPRIRRGRDLKNRRAVPRATESEFDACENGAKFNWPVGSGVRAASIRDELGAKGAESGRRQVGQGCCGDHVPLDAGKLRTLCLGGAGVN